MKKEKANFPDQLIGNRGAIECNFVFSLWKDPLLYDDYRPLINGDRDLISEDGKFYFQILDGIKGLGYEVADHMAVTSYLLDRKEINKEFEKRGGYATVLEILEAIRPDNVEGYYDELIKSNMLIQLYKHGFNVLDNLDHYQSLTSTEVHDELEHFLDETCASNVEKLQAENLSEDYSRYIKQWDEGYMKGSPVGFPLIEQRLMGVHKKNLLLHMAHIGNGKTTSAILFYIIPSIQNGDDVCIIANEQDISEFRQMILSTVVCNILKHRHINRSKFLEGGFTQDQIKVMEEGQQWLEQQPGKIYMVETHDYSIGTVKKIVKKFSKKHCSLFIFDTLKPTVESSEKAWAEFSEVAKQLFLLAKKCDVAIIATAQLSADSMSRRYLDLSCVGKSRAIAETATQVVMFRSVTKSEIENNKITAFRVQKSVGEEYENKTINVSLDPDKDYIVLFTPKNRFGSIGPPIIYERNMDYNFLDEIGFTNVDYDGFTSRG